MQLHIHLGAWVNHVHKHYWQRSYLRTISDFTIFSTLAQQREPLEIKVIVGTGEVCTYTYMVDQGTHLLG